MSVEFDSSPQDQLPRIRGSPEGRLAMRCGQVIVDFESGLLWQKRSPVEDATGWVEIGVATGAGTAGPFYGVGSPEGIVTGDQGALYSNSVQELWQKASAGSGNTGWVLMIS